MSLRAGVITLGPSVRRIEAQRMLLNVPIDALHEAPVDLVSIRKTCLQIGDEPQL